MGCGNSKLETYFEIKLYDLKVSSKNDFIINETISDLILMVEKKNLPNTILSHNKKAFFEFFETTESIKQCAFIIVYEIKKIKFEILSYESSSKIYPLEKFKKGDIIQKVYVFNIKEYGILLDDLYSLDIKTNLNNQIIKTKQTDNKINEEQDELEEVIIGETYEDDKEVENGVSIDIINQFTEDDVKSYIQMIDKNNIISICFRNINSIKISLLKKLLDKLTSSTVLRSFTFSDNHNSSGFDEGWRIIINFIENNKSLRNINISMSFLYDKYLENLCNSLKGKKISTLNLSSNFISFNGAKKIANWLKLNRSIKNLNIQQNTMNEFKKEGSDLIVSQLIKYHNIVCFDVSNMVLTGFGIKLSELIKTTSSLKELKIKSTRMNIDDHRNISKALCDNHTIETLIIGDNYPGIDEVFELISDFIAKNKSINYLNLDKMSIGKKTYSVIFDSIEKNDILDKLSFNENSHKIPIDTYINFFINRKKLVYLSIINKEYKKLNNLEEKFSSMKKVHNNILLK